MLQLHNNQCDIRDKSQQRSSVSCEYFLSVTKVENNIYPGACIIIGLLQGYAFVFSISSQFYICQQEFIWNEGLQM